MEFKTRYNRQPDEGEDISPDSKTETSGYIPAQEQIQRLLQSGVNLQKFRREEYDFSGDDPDDDSVHVPSRVPSFDLADGSELANQVGQRLAEQAAAIETAEKNPPAAEEEVEA